MATSSKAPANGAGQDGYEVNRLGQLCLPRWYDRIYGTVVRPERPEFAVRITGEKANPHWTRAVELIYQAISSSATDLIQELREEDQRQKRGVMDKLKEKLKAVVSYLSKGRFCNIVHVPEPLFLSPMEAFLKALDAFMYPDDIARPVLSSVALILYDQECGGKAPHPSAKSTTVAFEDLPALPKDDQQQRNLELAHWALLQHMFIMDYQHGESALYYEDHQRRHFRHHPEQGLIPAYLNPLAGYLTQFASRVRNGELSPVREWRALAARLVAICRSTEFAPENALSLYHYHSHRDENLVDKDRDAEPDPFDSRLSGYTGILRELIDEIPTRGPERLLRKLSADQYTRSAEIDIIDNKHVLPSGCEHESGFKERIRGHATVQEVAYKYLNRGYEPLRMRSEEIVEVEVPEFDRTHRDGYPIVVKNAMRKKSSWSDAHWVTMPGMGTKRRGFKTWDRRLMNSNTISERVIKGCRNYETTDEEHAKCWQEMKKRKEYESRARALDRADDHPVHGTRATRKLGCERGTIAVAREDAIGSRLSSIMMSKETAM